MKDRTGVRSFAARFVAAISLPILLLALYGLAIRPWQLRWGATPEEVARPMPGDQLVTGPTFWATRAITIQGRSEDIWPWLVQMGYNRAGYYGYDLIENIGSTTGLRSATTILPVFQHPKTGDVLPISAVAHLVFGEIQPYRYLIWRNKGDHGNGAFTWALYPVDQRQTRLVSRIRLRYHRSGRALALDLFTEFADPVAVPKILRGVKARVEGSAPEPLAFEAAEIATWLIAIGTFIVAVWLIFRQRRWLRAWIAGLTAGLVLLFAVYAHVPVWMSTVTVCAAAAAVRSVVRGETRYARPRIQDPNV